MNQTDKNRACERGGEEVGGGGMLCGGVESWRGRWDGSVGLSGRQDDGNSLMRREQSGKLSSYDETAFHFFQLALRVTV